MNKQERKTASLLGLASATLASLFIVSCDVDKTEDGSLPKVKVDGEAGELPKVEITEKGKMPSVDVKTEGELKLPSYDIDGPDIDVGTKKVTIEVPTIDVDLPDDGPEGDGDESKADLKE